MKNYTTYQYLGEEKTERDKREKNSNFWNEGKWHSFIEPLLPKDCSDMTLIDVGCNAGLYLRMATDHGFRDVIGVEPHRGAYETAVAYRDKIENDYALVREKFERAIDSMPVSDYVMFVNVHYYFHISDWIAILDKLQYKTRYCLVVSKDAVNKHERPRTGLPDTRNYFKEWDEVGGVYDVEQEGDPAPRDIFSMLFKSRHLDRMSLDNFLPKPEPDYQRDFYDALDRGTPPEETSYMDCWKKWRVRWDERKTQRFVEGKAKLLEDIRRNGLKRPILIRADNKMLDGNHRIEIVRRLGYESVIVRRV